MALLPLWISFLCAVLHIPGLVCVCVWLRRLSLTPAGPTPHWWAPAHLLLIILHEWFFLINLLIMFKVSYVCFYSNRVSCLTRSTNLNASCLWHSLWHTFHTFPGLCCLAFGGWMKYLHANRIFMSVCFFSFWGAKTQWICNQLVNSLTLLDPGESISFRVETNSKLWLDLEPPKNIGFKLGRSIL